MRNWVQTLCLPSFPMIPFPWAKRFCALRSRVLSSPRSSWGQSLKWGGGEDATKVGRGQGGLKRTMFASDSDSCQQVPLFSLKI